VRTKKNILKKILHSTIILLFINIITNSYAFQNRTLSDIDEKKNAVILEGIDILYTGDHEKAIEHFKQLDTIDPESSEGIFFEAFVLEFVMDQYRSDTFDERFNKVAEQAIEKANKTVERDPSARNYMFLGGAYGVK